MMLVLVPQHTRIPIVQKNNCQPRNSTSSVPQLHSLEERAIWKLLVILDSMECPDYAFESIMQWAAEFHHAGYNFAPKAKTRNANIAKFYNMIDGSHNMLPTVSTVPCDHFHDISMEVVGFDFVTQLQTLLTDKDLMHPSNLLLNPDYPFLEYQPPDSLVGSVQSGSRYREVYRYYEKKLRGIQQSWLLVPLIFYVDKTFVDRSGRFTVEPLTFTSSIFTDTARGSHKFWRTMGMMQDPLAHLSAAQAKGMPKGATTRNYHKQLDVIFKPLVDVQTNVDKRLNSMEIRIGKAVYTNVMVKCPILYVIGDTLGMDMLCGRYRAYNYRTCNRLSRSCNITSEHLDNPHHQCKPIEWEPMHNLSKESTTDESVLKEISQHKLDNAFSRLDWGGCKYGIFGGTPVDFMHVFKQGILKHCLGLFMDSLTPTQKAKLDSMAAYLYKNYRQTGMRRYPRVDFSNGLTSLKQKTADEETGATFVVCAVVHCKEAFKMIDQRTKRVEDQLNTFEMLLCFEQWCHRKTFWAIEQQAACKQSARDAVIILMESIKTSFPRGVEEEGWRLAKFHQLLHMVEGIAKFGAPENTSANRPEHNHRYFAKMPGRRSQKRHNTFNRQVARRLSDSWLLQHLEKLMEQWGGSFALEMEEKKMQQYGTEEKKGEVLVDDEGAATVEVQEGEETETDALEESFESGTKFWICWEFEECASNTDEGQLLVHATSFDGKRIINNKALDGPKIEGVSGHLAEHYYLNGDGRTTRMMMCTEYKRDQYIFRCHPDYRNSGPWYDWIWVRFTVDEGETEKEYPCRVVGIIPGEENGLAETELMVQACLDRTEEHEERDSVLFEEWEIDHGTYYFIPASSIVKHAFVIGDLSGAVSEKEKRATSKTKSKRKRSGTQNTNNALVSVVKDITEWDSEFTRTDEYGC